MVVQELNTQFSIRLPSTTAALLKERGRRQDCDQSTIARRYIEEGLRMDQHPGVVFRPGPTGRRPSINGGPDIWEIIRVIKNVETTGQAAIKAAADWLELPLQMIETAVRYYAQYPNEIDAWIEHVDQQATEAEQTWLREQEVLAA